MSLQERTLVVYNFDAEKTNVKLMKELASQGGPVRNVIMRLDHAFIEYEDAESVAYSRALLDGVELFGKKLSMEPKIKSWNNYRYVKMLHDYVEYDKNRIIKERQQIDMQAYYNQQPHQQHDPTKLTDPPLNQLHRTPPPVTINFTHNVNPDFFNFTPLSDAANEFIRPPIVLPGPSNPEERERNFAPRRQRNFNQNQRHNSQPNLNRSWSDNRPKNWKHRR